MKKLLLSFAFIALLAGPAMAQETPKPDTEKKPKAAPQRDRSNGGRSRGRRMGFDGLEGLDLTDEQKAKVEAAKKTLQEDMREALENRDWAKLRDLRKTYQESIDATLTDEQKKKRDEAKKKRDEANRERFRGMGRGEGGFGRRTRRQSPEQKEQALLKEIQQSLFLSKTQEGVIMPLIKKLLAERRTSREAVEKKRQSFLGTLKKGASKENAATGLAAFRKARDDSMAALKKTEDELAKQLDDEQKAKLVAFGIIK
jgi:Spy/CpxP family protein refolding chaperone